MRIVIPGEALSLNNAYTNSRRGRHLTPEGRAYKLHVHCHARNGMRGQQLPAGRLAISIHLHGNWDTITGKPRRRDIDNTSKLLTDALCGALGIDDNLIRALNIRATHDPVPHIEIELEAL